MKAKKKKKLKAIEAHPVELERMPMVRLTKKHKQKYEFPGDPNWP